MLILAVATTCGLSGCANTTSRTASPMLASVHISQPSNSGSTAPVKVDFATQVKPIFESRCQPCHFSGGTMYQRLPFDRQETIKALGTKLFTRIKDEKERSLIREFLAQ
jgi:hypothetical protein